MDSKLGPAIRKKQFMLSYILQKLKLKSLILSIEDAQDSEPFINFKRIDDTIYCFRNLTKFNSP